MNAHFLTFKGAPRWRDRSFWVVIAAICGAASWRIYWDDTKPSPFFFLVLSMLLLPSRAWLGANWLLSIGPQFSHFRCQKFDRIDHFIIRQEELLNSSDWQGDISVTLGLVRDQKLIDAPLSIQKGDPLDFFIHQMNQRQVLGRIEKRQDPMADFVEVQSDFSPPFASIEAERDALYKVLGREKPKLK